MSAQKTRQEETKTLDIAAIQAKTRIARFKGAIFYMNDDGYWKPLSEDYFRQIAYKVLGIIAKTRTNEAWDYVQYGTPDLTNYAQYIRMNNLVWDTIKVGFTEEISPEDCVYATSVMPNFEAKPSAFIMALADNDPSVYDDILQTIAPIFLSHKPAGVIWWKGEGRNGKTTLAQVLYDLFPGFISGLTIKAIEDERDAPALNGNLANIVKESSEGYIQDSKAYKSIGTHEPFPVHKFHSQQSVMIDGDLHHIFSANNIPTFGDKSDGAKRRTLLIPFEAKFDDDPTFIERTFTPEFYAQHLGLFLEYAGRLKEQNYHYVFGGLSLAVKERYDEGTNSAATYIDELLEQYIYAFDSYGYLYTDYENWCNDGGYSIMSRQHLRRAAENRGYQGTTSRDGDKHFRRYIYKESSFADLETIGGFRTGMHRQSGVESPLIERAEPQSNIQEFLDAIPD